jgi:hypothetical protein
MLVTVLVGTRRSTVLRSEILLQKRFPAYTNEVFAGHLQMCKAIHSNIYIFETVLQYADLDNQIVGEDDGLVGGGNPPLLFVVVQKSFGLHLVTIKSE